MPPPKPPAAGPAGRAPSATPLWAAFAFTFLSSIGTGVVTSGVYFVTKSAFDFTQAQNYALGVVMGLAYIAGAALAGPAIGWLQGKFPNLSARRVLGAITLGLGLTCLLPFVGRSPWAIWVAVVIYNPLCGALWPLVESFVSGGRPGPALRRAVSRWNVVWSAALVVAFFGLSPLVERHGSVAFGLLGLVHFLSLPLLGAFSARPGAHTSLDDLPHPDSFPRLLTVFRLLLPTSFMVISALSPFLPGAMERLGIPAAWAPALATAWLLPRVAAFLGLDLWPRWHGSWAMPIVGMSLLLAGFAMSVLAPLGLPRGQSETVLPGRLFILLLGLACFGIGVATIYGGAVYYAMEVGKAGVDAGGKHESLIGIGYTAGPVIGLLATLAARQGAIDTDSLEWAVLCPVATIALGVAAIALVRVRSRNPER